MPFTTSSQPVVMNMENDQFIGLSPHGRRLAIDFFWGKGDPCHSSHFPAVAERDT